MRTRAYAADLWSAQGIDGPTHEIIVIVKEHGAGAKVANLCRRHGMTPPTLYNWMAKYGGMEVSEMKRLKALEDKNRRLKKLLAEQVLDRTALKDLVGETF